MDHVDNVCVFCRKPLKPMGLDQLLGYDGAVSSFIRAMALHGMFSTACRDCSARDKAFYTQLIQLHHFEWRHARRGVDLKKVSGYPVTHPLLRDLITLGDEIASSMATMDSFRRYVVWGAHRRIFGDLAGFRYQVPVVVCEDNQVAVFRRDFECVEIVPFRFTLYMNRDGELEAIPDKSTLTRLEAAAFLEERYRTVTDRLASDPSFRACLVRDPMTPGKTVFDVFKLAAWVESKRK